MSLADRLELRTEVDLVLLASLLLPVTVVAQDVGRSLAGIVVSSVGLFSPRMRRAPSFWLTIGVGYVLWYWLDWRQLDNHMWLLAVWLLAVGVALSLTVESAGRLRSLATQARVLVALVFGAALVWKFRSPDFASGAFFEYTLLTDPRFEPLAVVSGVAPDALVDNRMAVAAGPSAAGLTGAAQVRVPAAILTGGTLLIEGAVFGAWAVPRVPPVLRHVTLALFCATTYLIAPVAGFGLILLAMGAATADTDGGRLRYLAGMAALYAWSVVWNAVVL